MTITMPDPDEVGCRCTETTTTSAHVQPHRQQQHVQFNDQEQEQARGCCTECCCCCQRHHGRGRQSTTSDKKNLKNENHNQNRHSTATTATTIINMEEEEEEESSDDNYDLEEEQDEEVQAATVSTRGGDGDGGGTCRKSHRSNIGRIFRGIFDTAGPTGISVALIWLGIWGLLDLYLFPTNIILSASLCIAWSIPLVALCEVLQIRNDDNEAKPKAKNQQQQFDGIVLAILTTLAGVLFWRGVWYLWDNLVFVNNPPLQKSLALIIGPVILLLNGTCQASVVGAPGIFPPPREQVQTNRETTKKKKTNVTVDDDLGGIGCEENGNIEIDDVESMSDS